MVKPEYDQLVCVGVKYWQWKISVVTSFNGGGKT